MNEAEVPKCLIFIDKEGNWFHDGRPIIRRSFILECYEHLDVDEEGRYLIRWLGQVCEVDVEDTALVIQRVDRVEDGLEETITVCLNDGTNEVLDLDSLWMTEKHVLYARVREGKFPARFLRPAYYQLAQEIDVDPSTHRYVIRLQGRTRTLPLAP